QHAIDRGPDPLLRGLHDPELDIARRELDPVEVARDHALRRQQLDPRTVRVLLDLFVVRVAETDRVRERADVLFTSGEKVPAIGGLRPAVAFEIRLLLRSGEARPFLRV